MKEKELFEISNFRIITLIFAVLFLILVVSSRTADSIGSLIGNLLIGILLIGIAIFLGTFVYSIFAVEDLPEELNNMLALFLIGGSIETVLYFVLPILGLIFGSIYVLYFFSKLDENNKILYNRFH